VRGYRNELGLIPTTGRPLPTSPAPGPGARAPGSGYCGQARNDLPDLAGKRTGALAPGTSKETGQRPAAKDHHASCRHDGTTTATLRRNSLSIIDTREENVDGRDPDQR
jgi:hypothetical protein